MPIAPKPAAKRLPGRPRRANSFEPALAAAFGEVIAAARVSLGVAQDAFALKAGIDRSNYGRLERGERQPSLALAFRIAASLGISPAVLISRVEDELQRHQDTNAAAP